jgi:DNA-binding CsgD family transcriptional regulator
VRTACHTTTSPATASPDGPGRPDRPGNPRLAEYLDLQTSASLCTAVPETPAPAADEAQAERRLYIAPYRNESPCDVEVIFDAGGRVCYADEQPGDRCDDGWLWERWEGTKTGGQLWAEHHPARQRSVMKRPPLCGGCAGKAHRDECGMLWLLHATAGARSTYPCDITTTTPPMCLDDARWALRNCRASQSGFIAVRTRDVDVIGVRGTVYSPTQPPQADELVLFHESRMNRVVANRMVIRLNNAVQDKTILSRLGADGHRGRAFESAAGPAPVTATPLPPPLKTESEADRMAPKVLPVPLSQSQQRTAELLVRGLSIPQAAAARGLSPRTVVSHTGALRIKLGVPARCGLHVLVHALIVAGLATVPAPDRTAPSLGRTQLRLLRAVAEHARLTVVARVAKTQPTDVATGIERLLQATGAEDLTQLVILAHGWRLLTPRTRAQPAGAAR